MFTEMVKQLKALHERIVQELWAADCQVSSSVEVNQKGQYRISIHVWRSSNIIASAYYTDEYGDAEPLDTVCESLILARLRISRGRMVDSLRAQLAAAENKENAT